MSLSMNKWKPIESMEIEKEVKKCIYSLVTRLKNPQEVKKNVNVPENVLEIEGTEFIPWGDLSMSHGYPGLCLLFGEMDKNFPEQAWDQIGHNYMLTIQQAIQSDGFASISLWGGISGIGMAARSLSRGGTRYQNFLSQLNQLLIESFQPALDQVLTNLETGVKMGDYDVMSGLCGVGRYLLLFKEEAQIESIILKLLNYLVRLSHDIKVNGYTVPGWYISTENQFLFQERVVYPKGNFNCGLAHGIPGPLALLSLAILNGIEIPGQRDAIYRIADWLVRWRQKDAYGFYWPGRISWEEVIEEKQISGEHREAWCYGSPGVARSLWIAGEATQIAEWQDIAVQSYQTTFQRPEENWNISAPTFCHGLIGLLQLVQRMYIDTGIEEFAFHRNNLIKRILSMYEENSIFGFYDLEPTVNGVRKMSKAGLLDGVAGTALVLLSMITRTDPEWDAVFLIN